MPPIDPSKAPPTPSESAPQPSAADSSPGFERASESEGPGFIADPGPVFDTEAAAAEPVPPPLERPLEALEEWEEDVVKGLLGIQGRVLHAAAGVSEQDWLHTDVDLAAIAPPLTRICNRYEPVRRYARHADPVTLATGVAAYVTRSLLERRQVLAEEAPEPDTQPIPPADEAPAPPIPPRQVTPSEPPPPPPPPRPAEADVDPTAINWSVDG